MFDGVDITKLSKEEMRQTRPNIQMIFQDSISSLDPHMTVSSIVELPLKVWNRGNAEERKTKVNDLLRSVGLDPEVVGDRKPSEFSGGQCQRISIARALALAPKVLICDEPVSSLDVSIQAQILNILQEMKNRYGLSLVFISHDLAVVRAISTRIVVMYLGKICEIADPDTLCETPRHHYTHALVSSVPVPDPTTKNRRAILQGRATIAHQPAFWLPLPHTLSSSNRSLRCRRASTARIEPWQLCCVPSPPRLAALRSPIND